jgi:hypothetical protein
MTDCNVNGKRSIMKYCQSRLINADVECKDLTRGLVIYIGGYGI